MQIWDDLREFMGMLEEKKQLVRVSREVDPILEINAIVDRLARNQGPAVLFESVKGTSMPVLGNLFGSYHRVAWAAGAEDFYISDRREQDLEHPGLSPRGEGARLGIDATRKWKEENYSRERPDIVTMDEGVMERVLKHWERDGLNG